MSFVPKFALAEIERMELEKIAKQEMEEDIALFDAMDDIVSVRRPGNDFNKTDFQTLYEFTRKMEIPYKADHTLDIDKTLKCFRQYRDSKATARGWDGVTRDEHGRPVIVTPEDIINEVGLDRILTTEQLENSSTLLEPNQSTGPRDLDKVEFLSTTEVLQIVSGLESRGVENWSDFEVEVYNRHLRHRALLDDGTTREFSLRKELGKYFNEDEIDAVINRKQEAFNQLEKTIPDDTKMSRKEAVEQALDIPADQPWLSGLSEEEATQKRKDMEDGVGVKYDQGKLRIAELIPPLWIRRLTEVLEYGCSKKYTMHNWKGLPAEKLLNAGLRHTLEVMEGLQDNGDAMCTDTESQLFNIYQAAWNLLAGAYILEKQMVEKVPAISVTTTKTMILHKDMGNDKVKQMSLELEEMLDKRLMDDDETTLYASDIYALIERYKSPMSTSQAFEEDSKRFRDGLDRAVKEGLKRTMRED